jgi:hypothetical protein
MKSDTLTPAQRAAAEEAALFKKNYEDRPWVNHANIPSAKQSSPNDIGTIKKSEDVIANQLANLMTGKAMLNSVPKQPTDEEMFGHLVPSEEQVNKTEQGWSNSINSWLAEASKPISSRFNSQEEEDAYWASIKVVDRDDGKSGY